jgi:hypothetical protein
VIKEGALGNQKTRKTSNWNAERVVSQIKILNSMGIPLNSKFAQENYRRLYDAARRKCGSWKIAVETAGLDYEQIKISTDINWNKDLVISEILKRYEQKLPLNCRTVQSDDCVLFQAARRHFGSWEKAVSKVGIDYQSIRKRNYTQWDESRFKKEAIKLINTIEKNNPAYLEKNHSDLYHTGKRLYGSWKKAIEVIDVDYEGTLKNRPHSEKNFKEAMFELINQGVSLSYSKIRNTYSLLFLEGVGIYGTWENAINSLGLDYDLVREDHNTTSLMGIKFERILDGVMSEVGIDFSKGRGSTLRPDYIVDNKWFDAKLSQWTVYHCDTVEKYEPHCKMLTLVFMRGDADMDEMLTRKTRLMSVHKLIKQLPRHRQRYYLAQIETIETSLNRIENGELSAIGNHSTDANDGGSRQAQ